MFLKIRKLELKRSRPKATVRETARLPYEATS